MSKQKSRSILIILIMALVCFFAFGCENKTPVNDIFFKVEAGQDQLVLLLGQKLEMDNFIEVRPNYATDKDYTLTSFDTSILKVENNKIEALKEGDTYLKVVSNDNDKKQDIISVSVKKEVETLSAPKGLTYDKNLQAFKFNYVENASNYILKINGQDINLGNSNTFNLSDYQNVAFDKVLAVKVKAVAPSYSFAFRDSDFTEEEYKIYQASSVANASVVGGELTFNKNSNNNVSVYLNEELLVENLSVSSLDLSTLDAKYAGKNKQLIIKSYKAQEEDNTVDLYCESKDVLLDVKVLDAPKPSINSSVVSWNNISGTNSYEVYVKSDSNFVKIADLNSNFFDLSNGAYEKIANNYQLKVKAVLPGDSINLLNTTKEEIVEFNRLSIPTLALTEKGVKWESVENAVMYMVKIEDEAGAFTTSTRATSISLENYESGKNYKVTVQALAVNTAQCAYLSSKEQSKEFVKKAKENAFIHDYYLNIETTIDEKYSIQFDIDGTNSYNKDIKAESNLIKIDLLNLGYNFSAGLHEIKLTHLGDGQNSLNSDEYTLSFTQLEGISQIYMNNSRAYVTRSATNTNATITLETTGGSLTQPLSTQALQIQFNTTNDKGDNLLEAGNYITKVYVEGDGENYFSYNYSRTGGLNHSKQIEFEVLNIPQCKFVSTAETKFKFDAVSNASSYQIYKNNVALQGTTTETEHEFELNSGSVEFNVQAIGNGSTTLSSLKSTTIKATRLSTPTLTYNSAENKLSQQNNNEDSLVASYITNVGSGSWNNQTPTLTVGNNEFTVYAKAVTKDSSDYYLDSFVEKLTVTKINSATLFTIANNQLVIMPEDHNGEYKLELKFNFDGGAETYTSSAGILANGTYNLPIEYSDGSYIVTLIDNNHNAINPKFKDGFNVSVKYYLDSTGNDTIANSGESDLSNKLYLTKISPISAITTNVKNELEIIPSGHTKEYDLRVKFNVNNVEYEFIGQNHELLCDGYKLTYRYEANKYYIPLLDQNANLLFNKLTNNFEVQVKYSYNTEGGTSDLDSAYSAVSSISFVEAVVIQRSVITNSDQEITNQDITFVKTENTHTIANYDLVINGTNKINLNMLSLLGCVSTVGNNIIISFDKFRSSYGSMLGTEEISLEIITRNDDKTSSLSKKSVPIKIQIQETVTLTYSKDNNSKTNNSVVVLFDHIETSYNKEYVLLINGAEIKRFNNVDVVDGKISINLDSLDLDKSSNIKVYIETYGTADNGTYMFNSKQSNELSFTKIDAPTGVRTENNKIKFNSVEHAVGYELYEVVGNSVYTKLNEELITSTEYLINSWASEKQLVLKAISENGGYTNSSYSEVFNINKLVAPVVNNEFGDFKISLDEEVVKLIEDENANISLAVNNSGKNININLKDVSSTAGVVLTNNVITIESYALLKYNTSTLTEENITFKYVINYTKTSGSSYYMDSNATNIVAYGLLSPTSVSKVVDDENETVELLTWEANANNIIETEIVQTGYVFIINYGGKTYSSTDKGLVYKNTDGVLTSYPSVIETPQVVFPCGYDKENDGILDVEFVDGGYSVQVKAIPLSQKGDYVTSSSKYSNAYTFTIMPAPTLSVENGMVKWNAISKATNYSIRAYDNEQELSFTSSTQSLNYQFADFVDKTGLFYITVQATSTAKDAVNSGESLPILVNRLPKATSVKIEDGCLILTANKYFTTAKITVKVKDDPSKTETIDYVNPYFDQEIEKLKIKKWIDLTDTTALNSSTDYAVSIDNSVLAILTGRNYEIYVQLLGNSNTDIPIINSGIAEPEDIGDFSLIKLKACDTDVKAGVVTFKPNTSYVQPEYITSETNFVSYADLNYVFNNDNSICGDFWKNTIIYKINLSVVGEDYTIYAVDYYSFKTAVNSGILSSGEYEELTLNNNDLCGYVKYKYAGGELYFNVYKYNKIDLNKDYISYYNMTAEFEDGKYSYTSSTTKTDINLTAGGSFKVDIFMLGDDSASSSVAHATSNPTNLRRFVRYGMNSLSANGGKINLIDMREYEEIDGVKQVIDQPVYRLTVTAINSEEHIVYLYYNVGTDPLAVAKYIAKNMGDRTEDADGNELSTNVYEFVPISSSATYEEVLTFDFSSYFGAGNYTVDIRTLAGGGNGENKDYLINSKLPDEKTTFYKYSDVAFTSNNGKLSFDLSNIQIDDNVIFIKSYTIKISYNGTEKEFTIDPSTEGVTIENNKLYYAIPNSILSVVNEADTSVEFNISVKANVTSETNLINANVSIDKMLNGSYINGYNFKKLKGVTEVKIENGVLQYTVEDVANYNGITIKISYVDANSETQTIFIETNGENKAGSVYTYAFESGYTYAGGYYYIVAGTNYDIQVQLKGYNNFINSDFSDKITKQKLQSVNFDSVNVSLNELTWDKIDNAVSYLVEFITTDETYNFVETATTNKLQLDTNKLGDRTYTVRITALGDEFINANYTDKAGFHLLPTVTNIKVGTDSVITWNAVEDADLSSYKITVKWGEETANLSSDENYCLLPNGVNGEFTISVQAIAKNGGIAFNSKQSNYTSTTERPKPVNEISYNEEEYYYYWTVNSSDFGKGEDQLKISYNIQKFNADGSLGDKEQIQETISKNQVGYYNTAADNYYYYKLTTIAEYSNFTVKVLRDGVSASDAVELSETKRFNIYKNGDGTEQNPYAIASLTHLKNIEHFANDKKYFKLVNDEEILIDSNLRIANTFNGVLDGNGKEITFAELELNGANEFALFGTLNGATIKNLTINATNITNTFAQTNSNVIKLSTIALNTSNGTTLEGVIADFNLTVSGSSNVRLTNNLYISGLVSNAENTTITNCRADAEVVISINCQGNTRYVAGMVAHAKNTNFRDIYIGNDKQHAVKLTLNATGASGSGLGSVGGLVAYLEGGELSECYVTATVEGGYNVQYFGGLFGQAEDVTVLGGEIVTNYKTNQINNKNLGAVAGSVSSSTIESVSVTLNIEYNDYTSGYVGAVAGIVSETTQDNNTFSITLNGETKALTDGTTTANNSQITSIGLYGYVMAN